MSIDELCALPVETLAEKDCLLFLWATFPQLPEALRLIKAWGFTFKTVAFVWLKFCLLYTSPSPRDYAASRMPSSA